MLREQILRMLSKGQFVSGQALGDELNVTRAAIAKHIKAINEMGLEVYSVKGKGYKLSQPLALLDKSKIEEYLSPLKTNGSIDLHTQITATRQSW